MTEPVHPPSAESIGLTDLEFFAALDADIRAEVAERFELLDIPGGHELINQGDPGDGFYVVVSGRFRASVPDPDAPDGRRVLSEMGRSETIGEIALLIDEPRTATVVALRDSVVARLSSADFERLIADHPQILRSVATPLVYRLARSLTGAASRRVGSVTIAVVPAHGYADIDRFVDVLTEALGEVDERVVRLDPGDARPLAEVEADADVVVMVSSPDRSGWSRRMVRQADTVLVVVDPSAPSRRSEHELALGLDEHWSGGRIELVLATPTERPRRGTVAHLATRAVDRHHHVSLDQVATSRRVANLVRNRGVGLVLGGGGARGMAHLGVVRAFDELGIGIDALSCASAGSLTGMALAAGWSVGDAQKAMAEFFARSPIDVTIPRLALASGARVTEALQHYLGDSEIADAWLDFSCVSTSLSRDEPHVHQDGPMWRAVRASISIPGVFPPVRDGDELLVDGGLADNLPVTPLRRRHPGMTVVAVDVSRVTEFTVADLADTGVFGWRQSLRGWRRSSSVPSLVQLLTKVTQLSTSYTPADVGDVTIRPAIDHIGLFEFERLDEAADLGYQAALAALDELPARSERSPG